MIERLTLSTLFQRLLGHFGRRHWWPADTPFEVAVGAILTQNTAWSNVEKAIASLKKADVLSPGALGDLPRNRLEELIRPAGFFRQKAERLQLLTAHLQSYHAGRLENLLAQPLPRARAELLNLKGVGPETADSILLYAGGHAIFVIDAYTARLLSRLDLAESAFGYAELQALFMERLPHEAPLFNEFHALIVEECKAFCSKKRPRCPDCPLLSGCPTGLGVRTIA